MEWSPIDGRIFKVDPSGPADGIAMSGDTILSIDGHPPSQTRFIFTSKVAGDRVQLVIQRGEEIYNHQLTLTTPSWSELAERLGLTVVALAFAVIGTLVLSFTPSSLSNNLFSLLCLCVSGILVSGFISSQGPDWASGVFNVLLWWIGPLTVHLHMNFPERRFHKRSLIVLIVLYLVAFLGSLPYILVGSGQLQASSINVAMYTAGRFNLVINLIIVVVILVNTYVNARHKRTRQQIRIISFFGILSLLIVVILTLLPSVLIYRPLIPYELSFLFLLLIPVSYGYSIVRYRLMGLERALNRGAALGLVFTLLVAIYIVIISLVEGFFPNSIIENPLLSLLIILPLAIIFEPLRKRIQFFVDWIFYGGWYDYRSAISNITEGFSQFTNANLLGQKIIERLEKILRLDYAYLIRISSMGYIFPIPESASFIKDLLSRIEKSNFPSLPIDGILHQYLLKNPIAIEVREIKKILINREVTKEEGELLADLDEAWIAPILANEVLLGLLVLGPKSGREVFSSEDFDIVKLVSRHAGIALYNIQLLNELRHRATEIHQLHQEILRAREAERKRLSLELHDDIIQSLVGLNFDLGLLDSEDVPVFRNEISKIIRGLREICSGLRPPALDNLGIVPAIRSLLRQLDNKSEGTLRTNFYVDGDEGLPIPEDLAVNIYRVLAESLNNVYRHAEANQVDIKLGIFPEMISVEVKDDGRGFKVPRPLGKLITDKHFGLVGMRERIEYFNGDLSINSSEDSGTHITISIPMENRMRVTLSERN
jgi:signal transduction histidine kinase